MITDPCLTPGFVHIGDRRPIESFYEVPVDPEARSCCPRAKIVSRVEFVVVTDCSIHGRRDGGNAD